MIPHNNPTSIVTLHATHGKTMAKGFTFIGGRWSEHEKPPKAYKYLFRFKELSGIGSWLTYAPTIPECAVAIFGGVSEIPQTAVRRQLVENGGVIKAVPRHLTAFDIDGMSIPEMPDWSRHSLVEASKYVRSQLGPIFENVTCVAQMTAKMGVTTSLKEFRGRLWFWCDKPIDQMQVKAVIKELNLPNRVLDPSILFPANVIYTAPPKLLNDLGGPHDDPKIGRAHV